MKIFKYERYIFIAVIFISCIPVLFNEYFPTVDGPCHLHNGNLLKHIFFYNNNYASNFYELNFSLNTNFFDHIWFAITGLFLPSNWSEKSFLLFYICLLPISFRYCLKAVASENNSALIFSYFIFPFIYSFSFRIGFFNFCFGLPFVFIAIGLWYNNRYKLDIKHICLLIILTIIIYASHILNFIFLLSLLTPFCIQFLFKKNYKSIALTALIIAPSIAMAIWFYITNNEFTHEMPKRLPLEKLFEILYEMLTVVTLNYENEIVYVRIVLISLTFLLLTSIIINIRKKHYQWMFLFSSIILLLLFFFIPDWIKSGGFISYRLSLFFFLALLLFISQAKLPSKLLLFTTSIVIINHLFYISYHYKQTKELNDDARLYVDAERYIEENKVILPLNYSSQWIQINNASYISTEKNIINLDNYEGAKPHFPLRWKKGEEVYAHMLKYANRTPPCIDIDKYESNTNHKIDYISRFAFNGDKTDSCTIIVEQELQKRFVLIYESDNKKLQLYKKKISNIKD